MSEERPRCAAEVSSGSFSHRAGCTNRARPGGRYCAIHDPEKVAARREERYQERLAFMRANEARRRLREQQNAERIADAIVPQLMLAERDRAPAREIIVREILRAQ